MPETEDKLPLLQASIGRPTANRANTAVLASKTGNPPAGGHAVEAWKKPVKLVRDRVLLCRVVATLELAKSSNYNKPFKHIFSLFLPFLGASSANLSHFIINTI